MAGVTIESWLTPELKATLAKTMLDNYNRPSLFLKMLEKPTDGVPRIEEEDEDNV